MGKASRRKNRLAKSKAERKINRDVATAQLSSIEGKLRRLEGRLERRRKALLGGPLKALDERRRVREVDEAAAAEALIEEFIFKE